MIFCEPDLGGSNTEPVLLCGARCAKNADETRRASVLIRSGRIRSIAENVSSPGFSRSTAIDLGGYLVLPGLINAHDHLQFALYPRLGRPPYRNYIEWGDDIHHRFAEVIAAQHLVPVAVRLWWGGIRNLLCGVTSVSHHDAPRPELKDAHFPVRIIGRFGWAHSVALGGDLRRARADTPDGAPFVIHACEGIDEQARNEVWELERLGLLDDRAVLIHGLALDARGVQLLRQRGASLIVCPSSNDFLFQKLPALLGQIPHLALGNDSPLTAAGDLLDEVRFAVRRCSLAPEDAYRMVTTAPAEVLRLENGEGSLRVGGVADLIAVRDTGQDPAEELVNLSSQGVELVMIGGRVQLASERILERLPASLRQGLEPLWADDMLRWLRAPVARLLQSTKTALGCSTVWMGRKTMRLSAPMEMEHVR